MKIGEVVKSDSRNRTSFRAIYYDKAAYEVIRTRNNRNCGNLIKFFQYSRPQEKNPINIHFSTFENTEKLVAEIKNESLGLDKKYQESFFYFLKNPLKFVKKMCKKADKYKEEYKLK